MEDAKGMKSLHGKVGSKNRTQIMTIRKHGFNKKGREDFWPRKPQSENLWPRYPHMD